MIDKERLLKMVDHLEQIWLENQALQIVCQRNIQMPLHKLRELFQEYIFHQSNRARAYERFAPLRELIQVSPQADQVLEALLESLQKIETLAR